MKYLLYFYWWFGGFLIGSATTMGFLWYLLGTL